MKAALVALLLVSFAIPVLAQGSSAVPKNVVVRQSVMPATGGVIGQHVVLLVDVLFRGDMPHPPRVSLQDVPGLQALRFETQATGLNETIAGGSYVGDRFEFALYARRGGTFDIPPAEVTLLDHQGAATRVIEGQGVMLAVTVPPGIDASGPVVATNALTLAEQWSPAPKGALKAGDALVRTITRTAEDVPGLAMRDLIFSAPEGVRAYVDPPDIDDHSNRGVVTGRRVDRVTYVFESGGQVVLPRVTQPWWDLADGTLKTAQGAGVTVEVAVPPPPVSGAPVTASVWRIAAGCGLALLLLLGFAARFLLRRRQAGDARAERVAFATLRSACAGSDAGATWRAFALWRNLLDPTQCEAATREAASLDATVFGGDGAHWNTQTARALLARLSALRRRHATGAPVAELPPLNPGG